MPAPRVRPPACRLISGLTALALLGGPPSFAAEAVRQTCGASGAGTGGISVSRSPQQDKAAEDDTVRVGPRGATTRINDKVDAAKFLLIEFGLVDLLFGDPSGYEMTQIDPPSLDLQQQSGGGEKGSQVLEYTETGDKPTPKDPKLTAWEAMRAAADALDATNDPNLIRLARAIRLQAESLFQDPPSAAPKTVSAAQPASAVKFQVGNAGLPALSGTARAVVTYDLPLLAALFEDRSKPDLFLNIGGIWTDADARAPATAPIAGDGTFEFAVSEFRVAIGVPALSRGKETVSVPLLLVPRLQTKSDQRIMFSLLLRMAEDAAATPVERSAGQILVESKIIEISGSSREIDGWGGNALSDALKKAAGLLDIKPFNVEALPDWVKSGRSGLLDIKPFNVEALPDWAKSGVTELTSLRLSPACRAAFRNLSAPVYSEPDHSRNVAPVPGLDPISWPEGRPPVPQFSLGEIR